MSTNVDMHRGFTKLFNTIVTSTIWQEDDKTRIVWITMLAIADAEGVVSASIPGLASVANVSTEAGDKAIKNLLAPDEYSRTKDHEGRRVEEIDGGWRILNYQKYRRMLNEEERREYKAKWIADKRRQPSTTVDSRSKMSTVSTHADAEAEAEADKKKPPNPLKGECDGFDLFWNEYPNKQSKIAAKRAWLKIKPDEREEVMRGIAAWKQSESWLKDDGQFIPYPATFLNQRRFEDSPKPKALKKKVYYNHLPPARNVPDSEWKSVADIAKREAEKFRQQQQTKIRELSAQLNNELKNKR